MTAPPTEISQAHRPLLTPTSGEAQERTIPLEKSPLATESNDRSLPSTEEPSGLVRFPHNFSSQFEKKAPTYSPTAEPPAEPKHAIAAGVLPALEPGAVPLLTLFTTFRPSAEKFTAHVNVIENWSQMIPQVVPVLFNISTDPRLLTLAVHNQWKILPSPKVNAYGLPFFKDMYQVVKPLFNTTFYSFCNGDILFNNGLYETLHFLRNVKQTLGHTLIVGRRSNFDLKNRTIKTFTDVDYIMRTEARLDMPYAEDYFILAAGAYPWDSMANVTIGRPAYDNYVVGFA
jgi:hypothetical protein